MAVRQRGGPWVMIQDRAADGTPVVRIEHHKLLILADASSRPPAIPGVRRDPIELLAAGGVTFTFPGEHAPDRFTNAPLLTIFKTPNTNALPFGPVEFVDTTFLPGTIAVNIFGHLLEAVPRTLYLDGREIPWVAGTNIVVPLTGKLPANQRPKRKSDR